MLTKKEWIELIVCILTIAGPLGVVEYRNNNKNTAGNATNSTVNQTSGNHNITLTQMVSSSTNTTQTLNVDTPAKYSSAYKIEKNDNVDYPYKAVVNVVADKNVHTPYRICITIQTDVGMRSFEEGGVGFITAGGGLTASTYGANYSCISNPAPNLIGEVFLNKKPNVFNVILSN